MLNITARSSARARCKQFPRSVLWYLSSRGKASQLSASLCVNVCARVCSKLKPETRVMSRSSSRLRLYSLQSKIREWETKKCAVAGWVMRNKKQQQPGKSRAQSPLFMCLKPSEKTVQTLHSWFRASRKRGWLACQNCGVNAGFFFFF